MDRVVCGFYSVGDVLFAFNANYRDRRPDTSAMKG